MAKDPAALLYIGTWLTATAEMDADARGWFLNLVLHQFDKGSLPNDVEKLAVLACVKFSEFERFKQVLNQVLMQKFKVNDEGRLENGYANTIITGREQFKDKRERSGNIGVVIKTAKSIKGYDYKAIVWLKERLYIGTDDDIEQAKDKQVLEQMLELYKNKDVNTNTIINTNTKEENKLKLDARALEFKETLKPYLQQYGAEMLKSFYEYWIEPNASFTKMRKEMEKAWDLGRRLSTWASRNNNFKNNTSNNSNGSSGIELKPLTTGYTGNKNNNDE